MVCEPTNWLLNVLQIEIQMKYDWTEMCMIYFQHTAPHPDVVGPGKSHSRVYYWNPRGIIDFNENAEGRI